MADISSIDSGSIVVSKVNDKLGTNVNILTDGSTLANAVNSKTQANYITSTDSGEMFASKINSAQSISSIRVVTMNVGHYADGNAGSPSFNAETYADYVSRFSAVMEYINADIICVQEYSANVYQQNAAKDVLFGNYPYYQIGTIKGYLGNAVFSKIPLTFVEQKSFTQANVSGRYYQLFEFELNGKTVGLINAHLDTTNSGNNYRNQQFGEIVSALRNYDYAIFGSDSNVARVQDDGIGGEQWEVINYWVNGGTYTVGNYGTIDFGSGYGGGEYILSNKINSSYLCTWPTTRWAASSANTNNYASLSCPCDNVAVKGFLINNPHRIDSADTPSNDLTDHCIFIVDIILND